MSKIIIGICTFLMLFITPSVQADPVVITGGSLSVVGFLGNPVYSLTGSNRTGDCSDWSAFRWDTVHSSAYFRGPLP